MQHSSYQDIIENKIEEWQQKMVKLQERAQKADKETKVKLDQTLERLNASIDSAVTQLRELDKQEDAQSTMALKEKILHIFDSVDQELNVEEERTPFML